jgi:hypothetical protein
MEEWGFAIPPFHYSNIPKIATRRNKLTEMDKIIIVRAFDAIALGKRAFALDRSNQVC